MFFTVVFLFFVIKVIIKKAELFPLCKKLELYPLLSEFRGFFFLMYSWGLALATHMQCSFLKYRCSSSYIPPIQQHKMLQNGV